MSTQSSLPTAYRKSTRIPKLCGLVVLLCASFSHAHSQARTQAAEPRKLRIAAAADLMQVMPVLEAAYEHATGINVVVSYGSSGTLTTQILNGAPIDLFLGADFTYPEQIVAAGKADTKSPIAYAQGTLVLWARKESPFQPLHLEVLTDARLKSVAIANELHAPYGRAAVSALRYLKLYDQVAPKLVIGENIAQTAQFVESGNAEVGLISLTAAASEHFKELGSYVLLPSVSYPKIMQYGVVMKASPDAARSDAHAFLDWLTSPAVQENLPKLGLKPIQ